MKKLVLWLLVANALLCRCFATPVIAVDVSRSMRDYGVWQHDAEAALANILFEGQSPDLKTWKSTGNLAVLKKYSASGNVVMLRFGSFPTQEYPYFSSVHLRDSQSLNSNFPAPVDFRDQKTNKPLALAVAATLSAQDSAEGYAIFVSDFLADSDISQQHEEFINNTETVFTQHIPLTLSWTKDPRLQLKFIHFERTSGGPDTAQASGSISLLPAEFYASRPVRYVLRWKADPGFERFSVKVEDSSSRAVLFERSNLASKEAIFTNPPTRAMRWYVVGSNGTGESVRSATQNLIARTTGNSAVPVILLLLVIVGITFLLFRAQKLPSWMERVLRRRKSEWS